MSDAKFEETLGIIRAKLDTAIDNMDQAAAAMDRTAVALTEVKREVEAIGLLMLMSLAGAVGIAVGFIIVRLLF